MGLLLRTNSSSEKLEGFPHFQQQLAVVSFFVRKLLLTINHVLEAQDHTLAVQDHTLEVQDHTLEAQDHFRLTSLCKIFRAMFFGPIPDQWWARNPASSVNDYPP